MSRFMRIVALAAPLAATSCLMPEVSPEPEPRQVIYLVRGTYQHVGLTYRNTSGGTEQRLGELPWKLRFRAEPGETLYLSAQKKQEEGWIEASIWIDGEPLQTAKSDDAYGIAQVSGAVP